MSAALEAFNTAAEQLAFEVVLNIQKKDPARFAAAQSEMDDGGVLVLQTSYLGGAVLDTSVSICRRLGGSTELWNSVSEPETE